MFRALPKTSRSLHLAFYCVFMFHNSDPIRISSFPGDLTFFNFLNFFSTFCSYVRTLYGYFSLDLPCHSILCWKFYYNNFSICFLFLRYLIVTLFCYWIYLFGCLFCYRIVLLFYYYRELFRNNKLCSCLTMA